MTRASAVLLSSPNVEGDARLRFGVLLNWKLTWLKALNASPRTIRRWFSNGILKLLLTDASKLTDPGTRTIPRVPTCPGYWPLKLFTTVVVWKMLGLPFSSV